MKIGIVTQYYPPNILGGSHISVFNVAKGLAVNGHSVEIFTSKTDKIKEINKFKLKGVKVHPIFDKEYSFGILAAVKKERHMIAKFKKFLKKGYQKFDILYSYGMDTIPAVLNCKKCAEKIAASVNGSWATCPYYHINYKGEECLNCDAKKFWYCTFKRIFRKNPAGSGSNKWIKILLSPIIFYMYRKRLKALKRIDIILPISYKLKKILINKGINKDKLFVCYNLFEQIRPANWSIFKEFDIPKHKKIILFAGRVEKIKGCHTIIEAIPKIIQSNKSVHFLFLGHCHEKELKRAVKNLNIAQYVTFGGFVNSKKLAAAYKQAYLTVYPSMFFDPLPRTPTESFMQGTPVIGTDRGGCEELIKQKYNGLQISPGSSKELAKAISKLIKNKDLYRKLSGAAKKSSKKFLIEKGIHNYINALGVKT